MLASYLSDALGNPLDAFFSGQVSMLPQHEYKCNEYGDYEECVDKGSQRHDINIGGHMTPL